MIKAQHTPWFQKIFNVYLMRAYKSNFNSVKIIGEVKDQGLPILMISNHISWWDGFWGLRINEQLFQRFFFVMMLEEQLRKNMFLRKLGAFSIKRKSRTMIDSINYAKVLLTNTENMLLLFPQGEIRSQYAFPFKFERGWERVFNDIHHPIQILLVCNIVDYFAGKKPSLYQYIDTLNQTTGFTSSLLEKKYNSFYQNCINQQSEIRI